MLTAQREGGLQHWRSCQRAWSTGVIAWLPRVGGVIATRLESASHQAANSTDRQTKLASDIRGGGSAPDHTIKCEPKRNSVARGIEVDSRVREKINLAGVYQVSRLARNFVSLFRAKLSVAISRRTSCRVTGVGDPIQSAGRRRAGNDFVDDPVAGPNADQLPVFRGAGECRRHAVLPRRIRTWQHEMQLVLQV